MTQKLPKISDSGLPDGEDDIIVCSSILTQYRRVTNRQTEICG